MLVVSGISREEARRTLVAQLNQPRVPIRLTVRQSRLLVTSVSWRRYWEPVRHFFTVDARLVQRLKRLKTAWLHVLSRPSSRACQERYCWRYFGLLHHAMRLAHLEPSRPDPLGAIHRIVGFETFPVEAFGVDGAAGGAVAERNALFLLGQLQHNACVSTPRRVPLLAPVGCEGPFYHYRQVVVPGTPARTLLLCPHVALERRANSFAPIDRLTRLVSDRSDPYWRPRARLLVHRILKPLLKGHAAGWGTGSPCAVLDLGAGTGHLVAKAWTYLRKVLPRACPPVAFHFVDSTPPAFGRSFGLSRDNNGVSHVEWTTAGLLHGDRRSSARLAGVLATRRMARSGAAIQSRQSHNPKRPESDCPIDEGGAIPDHRRRGCGTGAPATPLRGFWTSWNCGDLSHWRWVSN